MFERVMTLALQIRDSCPHCIRYVLCVRSIAPKLLFFPSLDFLHCCGFLEALSSLLRTRSQYIEDIGRKFTIEDQNVGLWHQTFANHHLLLSFRSLEPSAISDRNLQSAADLRGRRKFLPNSAVFAPSPKVAMLCSKPITTSRSPV